VQLLGTVRTPFLGVILNRFNAKTAGGAYYDYAAYPYSDATSSPADDGRRS
jgi:hypothetical protein